MCILMKIEALFLQPIEEICFFFFFGKNCLCLGDCSVNRTIMHFNSVHPTTVLKLKFFSNFNSVVGEMRKRGVIQEYKT